jgi:hypothetical protein
MKYHTLLQTHNTFTEYDGAIYKQYTTFSQVCLPWLSNNKKKKKVVNAVFILQSLLLGEKTLQISQNKPRLTWHSKVDSFHSPLIHTVNFCEYHKIKQETVNAASILCDLFMHSQHETVIFTVINTVIITQ